MELAKKELAPPRHPFEVKIVIGANDWSFVTEALAEIRARVARYGAEGAGMCLGGWDGSFSVDVERRDITADQFREELELWMESRR